MTLYIVPVVEGQTEQGCVERLLHRVWHELLGRPERLQVVEPFRGHRDELVHPSGVVLTHTVSRALVKVRSKAKRDAQARPLVLILLDAEEDCPKVLAPRLLGVARKALPAEVSVSCVLARRMLENWIVAEASSLAGVNGLPDALPARGQFEDRSGAAWLEAQLRSQNKARKYRKTDDAEVFVRGMALQECRDNSPSFDKLCRELEAGLPHAPMAESSPQPPAEGGT
ncbi:MAG: DUF4276 family protein [Gemmataceae bacterium]